MNLNEFISTLPKNVIDGDNVLIPSDFIRRMFTLCNLGRDDTFYHLGIGNNISTLRIAKEEFGVKKAVGIDIDPSVICTNIESIKIQNGVNLVIADVLKYPLKDATVIFSWFIDETINEILLKKFKTELQNDVQIISIWSPPGLFLPDLVDFPILVCRSPFRIGATIQDQLRSIYNSNCIDFTASWNLADKYVKAFGNIERTYHRFLNMLHSLIIWFNAREFGIACEDETPPPVKSYVEILRYFFNIDMSEYLDQHKS